MQTPWLRFSVEVVFEERQDIRDAIIEKSAIVNALYKNMRDTHFQGILSEKHRWMDDQPRLCQGTGE